MASKPSTSWGDAKGDEQQVQKKEAKEEQKRKKSRIAWHSGGIALRGSKSKWSCGGESSKRGIWRWRPERLLYFSGSWNTGAWSDALSARRGGETATPKDREWELEMKCVEEKTGDRGRPLPIKWQLG